MANEGTREGWRGERERPEHVIDEASALTEAEEDKVVERLNLRAPAVYAIVKEEGEAELARPTASLFWSGIVAGIAMGFSILTLALLRMHLPDADWEPLVSSFGYAAGFLIVVLGRQQLFTENTLTVVLPVLAERTASAFGDLSRVWGTVIVANWIGCVLIALASTRLALVPDDISAAIVAAMVWIMPGAEGSKFVLISFTAWLIALGGFTHAIAGMVEIAALVFTGDLSFVRAFFTLALPTLAGNIVGGTGLFALLAHAQVKDEV